MNAVISSSHVCGEISAIASKSLAHRLLIGSAFCDKETSIRCESLNDDILATVECLRAIGADISYAEGNFTIKPKKLNDSGTLSCNESGTTMRLLLPIVCALGGSWHFLMRGRLPERPLSPLKEELEAHGIKFERISNDDLLVSGKLQSGNYTIRADVSSQFVSGLMFALALLNGKSTLTLTGNIESAPYIDLTLDVLNSLGANITRKDNVFTVPALPLSSQVLAFVEGDWSNAAFPLCAAALGGSVKLKNLSLWSKQGDKQIIEILENFGADISVENNSISVKKGELYGIDINAENIPDLVPVIAVVASGANGTTRISGASRLRIKESDRLQTTYEMLHNLGADIEILDDGFLIHGKNKLSGGVVSSYNDHRIAMSAAVASVICENEVTVLCADATKKSYPDFWNDIEKLGFNVKLK